MNRVFLLWKARNKEYYRDKGSLFWSFLVTPFLVIVLALAFSHRGEDIFKIGVYNPEGARIENPLLEQPAVKVIHYRNWNKALSQVRYHQIDLLLRGDQPDAYWVNPASVKGQTLVQLAGASSQDKLVRHELTGRKVRYIDWAIPGILAMNLMFSGLFGVGYVIVRYRKNNVLKRLQATPVRAWEFLVAQLLSRMVIMLIVTIMVYTVCNLMFHFQMLGSYWLLLVIAVLSNLSIVSLSLVVAARIVNEELANGILNLISFPMMLLSELWFPLDGAPGWMKFISNCLPLTHTVKAARAVMLEGAGWSAVGWHLVILVAMSIAFLIVGASMFKWHKA